MKSILILLSIISLSMSQNLMGGYIADSFASNDMLIDRSWREATQTYYEKTNTTEDDVFLYPIAIYKQLVNGINYKLFFGAQNLKSNKLDLLDYVVYSSQFNSEAHESPSFKVTKTKNLEDEKRVQINSSNFGKINAAVARYIGNKNEKMSYLKTVVSHPNVIGSCGIYVVKAHKNDSKKDDTYILFEDENGQYKVVDELRYPN